MAITNFVPELWSAAVMVPFEENLIFAQPSIVNRDYEGTIRQQGDTVHVTSIADVTVRKYDKNTDLTVEDLDDDSDSLVIDQGDYFAFRVHDVDKVQAAGDFQSPATRNASHGLATGVDRFLSGIMAAGADTANRLGEVDVAKATPGDAYDLILDLGVKLTQANAPQIGRFVVVSADFYSVLLRDDRFVRVDASGSSAALRQGIVGRVSNFDVLQANGTPTASRTVTDAVTTASSKTLTSATANFTQADVGATLSDGGTAITAGTTIASVESATSVTMSANSKAAGTNINLTIGTAGANWVIAGIPDATSLAVQITETEALRSQNRFADVVRGLQIYGGKVFRGAGLATASTKVS